jgi:hypothetical protein
LMDLFTVMRATGLLPLLGTSPAPLMGLRHAGGMVAMNAVWSIFFALFYLLVLLRLRKLLRREWAAVAAGSVLLGVLGSLPSAAPAISLPFQVVVNVILFLILARVGLVASIAAAFVANVLPAFPVVWPPDAWFSGIGFLGLGLMSAIAIVAFRIVTGSAARKATRALEGRHAS